MVRVAHAAILLFKYDSVVLRPRNAGRVGEVRDDLSVVFRSVRELSMSSAGES